MLLEYPTGRQISVNNVVPLFAHLAGVISPARFIYVHSSIAEPALYAQGPRDDDEVLTEKEIEELGLEEAPEELGPSDEEQPLERH